ncbi:hypothetical protein [Paraburkholderia sp. 32]|uniref:hypothetical protein n=1 Tax=Paraburkholderia sp. 32 TaxID=2991057 RepID=UPI003D21F173
MELSQEELRQIIAGVNYRGDSAHFTVKDSSAGFAGSNAERLLDASFCDEAEWHKHRTIS